MTHLLTSANLRVFLAFVMAGVEDSAKRPGDAAHLSDSASVSSAARVAKALLRDVGDGLAGARAAQGGRV